MDFNSILWTLLTCTQKKLIYAQFFQFPHCKWVILGGIYCLSDSDGLGLFYSKAFPQGK